MKGGNFYEEIYKNSNYGDSCHCSDCRMLLSNDTSQDSSRRGYRGSDAAAEGNFQAAGQFLSADAKRSD